MSDIKKTSSDLLREYNDAQSKLKRVENQIRNKYVTIIKQSPYRNEDDFPYNTGDNMLEYYKDNLSIKNLLIQIDVVEIYHELKANIVQGDLFK